jgi:hypothetical protein
MWELGFISILGEVLLPLALVARLLRSTCRSRVEWLLQVLSLCAYLALISVVGTWLLVPWYVPYGYALLGVGAAALAWHRADCCRPRGKAEAKAAFPIASGLGLTVFCTSTLLWALSGYAPPEGPFTRLASPLKGGTYYVVNGGYSILINPHMKTLARESLSGYRAQSYALDIVRIDRLGLRAEGLWPADLTGYRIFGEPVYAPCTGRVVQTEERLPDQTPPESDRLNPAGNFVRIECGEADVLLAHLMHSSLTVVAGQRVQTEQLIGRVGNSGLSTEPHLHLHAQLRGPEDNFLAGEPMPVWVDGRILVRNSRFTGGN